MGPFLFISVRRSDTAPPGTVELKGNGNARRIHMPDPRV